MAATSSLICSPTLPLKPFSGVRKDKKGASTATYAMRKEADNGQNYHSGRLVDKNMIVLRKRIHEMKMIERNYEPPAEWMDWERSFYTSYDSMICEAMGVLQSQLMNTRPSLALGMIALVTLSVPTSTLLGMIHVIELTKGILAGIHLG